VQRIAHTPIVSISLNKVRVTSNNRSLFRVEIGSRERPHVELPIGPMYKRATVRTETGSRTTVHIEHENAGQPSVRQERHDNPRVIVQPQSDQAGRKVRVEVRSNPEGGNNQDNDRHNDGDNSNNGHEKHRVKVELNVR
jgi:hypothetical protein